MIDTKVNLGGLKMSTPITTASGTFGYGSEYLGAVDYSKLGAITVTACRGMPKCQEAWLMQSGFRGRGLPSSIPTMFRHIAP